MSCTVSGLGVCVANGRFPRFLQRKQFSMTFPGNREMLFVAGTDSLEESDLISISQETVQHLRIAIRIGRKAAAEPDANSDFLVFDGLILPKALLGYPFASNTRAIAGFFSKTTLTRRTGKHRMCCILTKRRTGIAVICLDHPHASLFLSPHFQAGSEIFMIPESSDSNSVDLIAAAISQPMGSRSEPIARQVRRTHVWEQEGFGGCNYQRRAKRRSRVLLLFYRRRSLGLALSSGPIRFRRYPAKPLAPAASFAVTIA